MSAKSLSENGCVQFIFTESLSAIIEKLFIIAGLLGVVRLPREGGEGSGVLPGSPESRLEQNNESIVLTPL